MLRSCCYTAAQSLTEPEALTNRGSDNCIIHLSAWLSNSVGNCDFKARQAPGPGKVVTVALTAEADFASADTSNLRNLS